MWREEGTARSLGGMAQGPTTTTGLGATQAPLWLHHRPALAVVGWEGFCPAYQPQGCEGPPTPATNHSESPSLCSLLGSSCPSLLAAG